MATLVTCVHTCHMWSHVSHVVTLVACSHTCQIFRMYQKLQKSSKQKILQCIWLILNPTLQVLASTFRLFLPAAMASRRPTSYFVSPPPFVKKFKNWRYLATLIWYKLTRYKKLEILMLSAVSLQPLRLFGGGGVSSKSECHYCQIFSQFNSDAEMLFTQD